MDTEGYGKCPGSYAPVVQVQFLCFCDPTLQAAWLVCIRLGPVIWICAHGGSL